MVDHPYGSSFMESGMTDTSISTPSSTYPALTMPIINAEELIIGKELGRGQFASVKLAYWKGVRVALKEWHELTDEENTDMAVQEGSTLACLRHPCVVSFYGMLQDGPSRGLVLEYMQHLSLKSKLETLKGSEMDRKEFKVSVALQAARGMEFLHSRKVIHFDLKCDNLLCDLRDMSDPVVKIGDVGLSKEKMKTFVSGNMRGTLPWMAPELFPDADTVGSQGNITDQVNEKIDIYSFGVVLWEIWNMGATPYADLTAAQLLEGILNWTLVLEPPLGCDQAWVEVMNMCLDKDPNLRPSSSEIVAKLEELRM